MVRLCYNVVLAWLGMGRAVASGPSCPSPTLAALSSATRRCCHLRLLLPSPLELLLLTLCSPCTAPRLAVVRPPGADIPDWVSLASLTSLKQLEVALASSHCTALMTGFACDDMGSKELGSLYGRLAAFAGAGGAATATATGEDGAGAGERGGRAGGARFMGGGQQGRCGSEATGAGQVWLDAPHHSHHSHPGPELLQGLLSCSSGAAAANAAALGSVVAMREAMGQGGQQLVSGGEFLAMLLGRAWAPLRSLKVGGWGCGGVAAEGACVGVNVGVGVQVWVDGVGGGGV